MTRQFPNAGPRFKPIIVPSHPEAKVPTPEAERRASHLQLIEYTHPLKAVAIYCLRGKERERPTAQQLNDILSEMTQALGYTESLQQMQRGEREGEVTSLRKEIRDLQQSLSEEIQQQNQLMQQEIERLRVEMTALMTAPVVNISNLKWKEGTEGNDQRISHKQPGTLSSSTHCTHTRYTPARPSAHRSSSGPL